MSYGTQKSTGYLMTSQLPLDAHYLSEGAAWIDEADALAGIPIGSRSPYKLLIVGTVLYWFLPDLTTLQPVTISTIQNALGVAITDPSDLFVSENVENALAEIMTYAQSLGESIASIGDLKQNQFPIIFGAYSTVANRVTNVIYKPTGWTIAASGGTNLLITHNLNRKCSGVNVFEIDGANERLLPNFSQSYTGVLSTVNTVLIEGLVPEAVGIRIILFFE